MKRVAYLSDPLFYDHDPGPWHPESPARLRAIETAVAPLKKRLLLRQPILISETLLARVHTPEAIETVREHCLRQEPIDADTLCSAGSWQAALAAAGAGIVGIDTIVRGEAERLFCAVRPPGHHATARQAMGFCLFNNVAVTARYAQEQGYRKIAIVDFDVHHGNGTQAIFYRDGSVLYFSTHQTPAYPGTGLRSERGEGEGEGTTINHPLPPGSGDAALLPLYREALPEALEHFQPDLLLVSAGYDLHEADPLADFRVTTPGVRALVEAILTAADTPVLFMLEGGYATDVLGECVAETLRAMLETP